MLLRTGKTPTGAEAAGHIRRLVRHIRRHWPRVHIAIRGDGHYGRPEVMAWCEANGVDYVLGLPTNAVLRADPVIVTAADACATKRAINQDPVLRYARKLLAAGDVSRDALVAMDARVRARIAEARKAALQSPYPAPESALDSVFA